MGVRANQRGVTLKFLDATGTQQTRADLKGEFAFFFSKRRPELPGDLDPKHGSQDWLTDLIVVDNPAKLVSMPLSQTEIAYTSASSKKVIVRWGVGGDEGREDGCVTIATGDQASAGDYLFADSVLVLPAGTVIDESHALWPTWSKMVISLPP